MIGDRIIKKFLSVVVMLGMVVPLMLRSSGQKVSSSHKTLEEVATTMIQVENIDIACKIFGEGESEQGSYRFSGQGIRDEEIRDRSYEWS